MGERSFPIEMAWGLRIPKVTVLDPMQIRRLIDFADTQVSQPYRAGMPACVLAWVEPESNRLMEDENAPF